MLNLQESKAIVAEVMPTIEFPQISVEPLMFGSGNVHPTRKALVGKFNDNLHLYSDISGKYQIIHHEEVAGNIIDFVEASGLKDQYGTPVFVPTFWNNGGKMKMTATFKDNPLEVVTPKGSVKVAPRITIINSYDLSKKLQILFEALQLICSNGMMAYRAIEENKKRHMIGLDLGKQLELIRPAMERYPEQMEFWGKLGKKYLTGPQFEEFITELPFGQRYVDELIHMEIIGSGGTLYKQYVGNRVNTWEIHNAVTQFITHNIESEDIRLIKSQEAELAFTKLIGR